MINSKSYVTLEKVILASSVGLSALELLFNHEVIIVDGNDIEFNLIKEIEELTYNKEYDKIVNMLKQYTNG
jgi:hypothetical protein